MLDFVGLVHMNGRVYDPSLGRFLSVDPVFAHPTNTQSLNPYSYVLNSPLTLVDPSGLEDEPAADKNVAGASANQSDASSGDGKSGEGEQKKEWKEFKINRRTGAVTITYTDGSKEERSLANSDGTMSEAGAKLVNAAAKSLDPSKIGGPGSLPSWGMFRVKSGWAVHPIDDNGNAMKNRNSLLFRDSKEEWGDAAGAAAMNALFAITYIQSAEALASEAAGVFNALTLAGKPTVVVPNKGTTSGPYFQSGGTDGKFGVIHYNFNLGLSTASGVQSAALGFAHEAAHALRAIRDPEGAKKDKNNFPGKNYSPEERRVMGAIETPLAKALGEPTREYDDRGSHVVRDCVTCR